MYQLNIAEELEQQWRSVVEREVSLTLPHLQAMGLNASLVFGIVNASDRQYPTYRCAVEIKRGKLKEAHVSAQHRSGREAIRNALLRVKRDLARARTWQVMQTASRERFP